MKVILRVGRDDSCEIPIADKSVSTIHAEIELTKMGELFIVDRNSTNGTYILRPGQSKIRIEQSVAKINETVRFGLFDIPVLDLINMVQNHKTLNREHNQESNRKPVVHDRIDDPIRCSACGDIKSMSNPICPKCGAESRRLR